MMMLSHAHQMVSPQMVSPQIVVPVPVQGGPLAAPAPAPARGRRHRGSSAERAAEARAAEARRDADNTMKEVTITAPPPASAPAPPPPPPVGDVPGSTTRILHRPSRMPMHAKFFLGRHPLTFIVLLAYGVLDFLFDASQTLENPLSCDDEALLNQTATIGRAAIMGVVAWEMFLIFVPWRRFVTLRALGVPRPMAHRVDTVGHKEMLPVSSAAARAEHAEQTAAMTMLDAATSLDADDPVARRRITRAKRMIMVGYFRFILAVGACVAVGLARMCMPLIPMAGVVFGTVFPFVEVLLWELVRCRSGHRPSFETCVRTNCSCCFGPQGCCGGILGRN
jgi:hypothetical protein